MKSNLKDLISSLVSEKETVRDLEDLQYNLSTFLNEDIYLDQFSRPKDGAALLLLFFMEKKGLILITSIDERIVLTPLGESLLIELNSMLLYGDTVLRYT